MVLKDFRGVGRREGGDKNTHAETEAGDEGKGAATPNRNHRDVKGTVFGADLCGYYSLISASQESGLSGIGTRPSKQGHGPLDVMYPESLLPKLKCVRGKE
jgi:hypothetical protein